MWTGLTGLLNFFRLVIETLNDVDPDRKCFRMIGGVLVERTVKEVTPALSNNRDKMTKLIEVSPASLNLPKSVSYLNLLCLCRRWRRS